MSLRLTSGFDPLNHFVITRFEFIKNRAELFDDCYGFRTTGKFGLVQLGAADLKSDSELSMGNKFFYVLDIQ